MIEIYKIYYIFLSEEKLMIKRMSHKKRTLLECLPCGLNGLVFGIVFLIVAIIHPVNADLRVGIFESIRSSSVLEFIMSFVVISPMLFSLFICCRESHLDTKMQKYDEKNGTKTYEAYCDETYKQHAAEAKGKALELCILEIIIECILYFFVKAIPYTAPVLIGMALIPAASYWLFDALFFCLAENAMMSSDSDSSVETVIA